VPLIVGGADDKGAVDAPGDVPETTAVAAEEAFVDPTELDAVTATRTVLPAMALSTT
jgi:hypothetical protein